MARKYGEGDEPVPGSGYRLTEFLGRGGFGEVWKASAPGGAEAALKIIALGGTEGRKEFRALQLVKKVRHSHLVPIFAFWLKNGEGQIIDDALIGTAETCPVETKPTDFRATMAAPPVMVRPLATELIIAMGLGDKSLYDRLQERLAEGHEGVPQEELLHYLEGAAEAIDFLNRPVHNLGSGPVAIQHCDIKPHNLMIVGGGVQVCDFGLARMMGADRTTTAAATLAYAAPECLVEGRPSATTDQYSLAVTYYELRTGVLPYRDETLAAVMDAKRLGQLDFSKVGSGEQAVLRRATCQNPTDRFPSCLEMVAALKRAAVTVPATQTVAAPRKTAKRGKLPLVFAGLILVCAIGGGYALMNRDRFLKSQNAANGGEATHPKTSDVTGKNGNAKPIVHPKDVVQTKDEHSATNKPQATTNIAETPADKASALLKSARLHNDGKQWEVAMRECSEAIALDPGLAEAYLLRGRCYLNSDPVNVEKAIEDFEKVQSLDRDERFRSPADFAAAYLGRGTEMLQAERYDDAIGYLTKAGTYDQNDYRIFSRLGEALRMEGQWQQAVDAFDKALAINSTEETDYLNRGRAYRRLGQSEKALTDCLRAATINPQNPDVQFQLGSVYRDMKQQAEAVIAFGNAIDLLAKLPEAKNKLAEAYFGRALAYFRIIDAESEKGHADSEHFDKAVADLTKAHDLRLSLFEDRNETEAADVEKKLIAELKSLEKNPNDVDAMNNTAYYLATAASPDIRDADFAIIFASRACIVSSFKSSGFLDTLAAAYAEGGDFEEAAKWEAKAIELLPDNSEKNGTKSEYRNRLEHYKKGEK
jgi:tetratricopeptide (TPR) repeat protein